MGLFTPNTMDAKRQAWTRKRPGQASGSDHPRSPLPRGREPTADYTEEVPIGMSRRGPATHATYAEEVPVGMSQYSRAPRPRRSTHTVYEDEAPIGMSRQPAPPSERQSISQHAPTRTSSRRATPTAIYEEEVPIGMSRHRAPSHTHTHVSHHQSSRADPGSRMSRQESRMSRQEARSMQDARSIRDELPALSIHEPQSRGSRGGSYMDVPQPPQSRFERGSRGGRSYMDEDEEGYVPQPLSRASRLESSGMGRRGGESRYDSRR